MGPLYSTCGDYMARSGASPPGFAKRIGGTVYARGGAEFEELAQALFLRTPSVRDFFLDFVRREFPWALPRYLELFPRPGSAPPGVRDGIERLVAALARETGF